MDHSAQRPERRSMLHRRDQFPDHLARMGRNDGTPEDLAFLVVQDLHEARRLCFEHGAVVVLELDLDHGVLDAVGLRLGLRKPDVGDLGVRVRGPRDDEVTGLRAAEEQRVP